MSQKDAILTYLVYGDPIDAPTALRLFRCYRLAARIYELRRAGHLIHASRNGAFTVYWCGKRSRTP
jgi:Helix-turn-helix domain